MLCAVARYQRGVSRKDTLMKRLSIVFAAILCASGLSASGATFDKFLVVPDDTLTDTIVVPVIPFNQTDNYDYIIGFKGHDPNDASKLINPQQATINLSAADLGGGNKIYGQLPGTVNVYNGSKLVLLAGADQALANEVVLRDTSQLIVNTGRIGLSSGVLAIDARGSSQTHLKGGLVLGNVAPGEDAKVFLEGPAKINGRVDLIARSAFIASSGHVVGEVKLLGQSTAAFSGDVAVDGALIVDATDGGSATIDGGTLGEITDLAGKVTMSGGIGGNVLVSHSDIDASKTGVMEMTGGAVQGVSVNIGGVFSLQGGTVLRGVFTQNEGSIVSLGAATVTGDVFATDKATIDIDGTQIGGNVTVGGGSVIEMHDGSVLSQVNAIGGQFKLHGGSIIGIAVNQADNSSDDGFTMDGGTVGALIVQLGGRAHVSGGTIEHEINVDDGNLQMENASAKGTLIVEGSSTAQIADGTIGAINLHGEADIKVKNASVKGDVSTGGSSRLSFFGDIGGDVDAFDTSHIDLGASLIFGTVTQHGQSTITWDTNVGKIVVAQGSGVLGGRQSTLVTGADNDPKPMEFFLLDESILQIFGRDFLATLLDGNAEGKYSEYAVTGHFADGEPFPTGLLVFVENGHEADPLGLPHFEFAFKSVPEPSCAALIWCTMMVLGCRRVASR
jgi:hypothetical protein